MTEETQTQIEERFAELEAQVKDYLTDLEEETTPQEPDYPPVAPAWIDTDAALPDRKSEKASILDLMRGDVKVKSSRSRGDKD